MCRQMYVWDEPDVQPRAETQDDFSDRRTFHQPLGFAGVGSYPRELRQKSEPLKTQVLATFHANSNFCDISLRKTFIFLLEDNKKKKHQKNS